LGSCNTQHYTARGLLAQGEGSFFQACARHPRTHKSSSTSRQMVAQAKQQLIPDPPGRQKKACQQPKKQLRIVLNAFISLS